jgi:hypothetical protein
MHTKLKSAFVLLLFLDFNFVNTFSKGTLKMRVFQTCLFTFYTTQTASPNINDIQSINIDTS